VIVDAHVHLWDFDRNPQPWMGAEHSAIARNFTPHDLEPLLERNGVDAVVVVQGACNDVDTDYLLEQAENNDWIAAVTAWVDLLDPLRAAERLDELSAHAKFRAIRHLIHNEEDDHWIVRSSVLESLALLEERDVLLELPVVFPRHFDDVVALAERFPRLRIVVDHLGKPPTGRREMDDWERMLRAAAAHGNVCAKVSGLNTTTTKTDWESVDLRPAFVVALDAFGPKRLLAGSDWPVALLNGDYDRVWQAIESLAHELDPGSADAILGGTAAALYAFAAQENVRA
jgi:L-fuconolactonase